MPLQELELSLDFEQRFYKQQALELRSQIAANRQQLEKLKRACDGDPDPGVAEARKRREAFRELIRKQDEVDAQLSQLEVSWRGRAEERRRTDVFLVTGAQRRL